MKRRFLTHASADGPLSGTVLVLWHGAGGDIDQPHLVAVAKAAAAAGAFVARARFDYRMQGKRAPDRMPKCVVHARETIGQVVKASGLDAPRLVLGGRSMGGRVASMLAAEGDRVDGLLFLAYPLHPAGKPEKLRDAHLYEIAAPMFFAQGTKDALSKPELLAPVLARLGARATHLELVGADHGYKRVPEAEVVEPALAWLKG